MLFSVIVPIYNGEKKLERCINSLIRQTYKNIEIILVDDGSSDDTLKICKDFSNCDSRIKVFTKKNEGVSKTRNYGINLCKGEYISFVDCDDYIKLDTYEKLFEIVSKYKYDLICWGITRKTKYGLVNVRGVNTVSSYNTKESVKENVLYRFIHGNYPLLNSPCNKLYSKQIIDQFDVQFNTKRTHGEDYEFNMNFCSYINSACFIPNYLYIYDETQTGSATRQYVINAMEKIEYNHKNRIYYLDKWNLKNKFFLNILNKDLIRILHSQLLNEVSFLKTNTMKVSINNIRSLKKHPITQNAMKEGNYSLTGIMNIYRRILLGKTPAIFVIIICKIELIIREIIKNLYKFIFNK